jgi:hypothetical protein
VSDDAHVYTFEWPLWGMNLDDCPPGIAGALTIEDSLLYQPTWLDWSNMESSAVVTEYCQPWVAYEAAGRSVQRMPPPCLLRQSEPGPDDEPDPPDALQEKIAKAMVAAFRVYSHGEFVNPNETGTYMSHPSGLVSRRVSSLRCGCYGWTPEDPYVVSAEDLEEIERLAHACWVLHEDPQHANAGLTLENFVLSFGFVTPPPECGLHRFVALEALFGQMRTERGTPFAVRVANTVPEQAGDIRDWLAGPGLELRNALAHRMAGAVVRSDDLTMLEDIVRCALLAYLNHAGSVPDANVITFNKALADGPLEGRA